MFNINAQFDEKNYELDYSQIDSVTLVEYTGIPRFYHELNLKEYQPNMNASKRQSVDAENEILRKKYQDILNRFFPNQVTGRDMSQPPNTITILNKAGEFYPNTKWETYRTFPKDSVIRFLKLLNCEIKRPIEYIYDTIYPSNNSQNDTLPIIIKHLKRPTTVIRTCGPHLDLGIILWKKGEVLQIFSTGPFANSVVVGYLENGSLERQNCVDMELLKVEMKKLGYFKNE
jgi:hypothetical protein